MIRTLTGLATVLAATVALAAAPVVTDEGGADGDPRTGDPSEAAAVGIEWGGLDAPIRPGSAIRGCTANFLFFDRVTGTAYLGTAAHCTDQGVGERVSVKEIGEVGTVVFDSDDIGSAVDFTLIELDEGMAANANPTMRGWEHGPTGAVTTDDLARGDQIDLHGYGILLGQNSVTRSRHGYLFDWTEDEFVVNMPAVWGDSGSPLLHDATGKAFGIVSRFGTDGDKLPSTDAGPIMPFIFRELAANGFPDVVLATIA